jgi:hypothetical protein
VRSSTSNELLQIAQGRTSPELLGASRRLASHANCRRVSPYMPRRLPSTAFLDSYWTGAHGRPDTGDGAATYHRYDRATAGREACAGQEVQQCCNKLAKSPWEQIISSKRNTSPDFVTERALLAGS